MSQKYDKIAKTLEYLIHNHFLFKTMTQMPRFHTKTTELEAAVVLSPRSPRSLCFRARYTITGGERRDCSHSRNGTTNDEDKEHARLLHIFHLCDKYNIWSRSLTFSRWRQSVPWLRRVSLVSLKAADTPAIETQQETKVLWFYVFYRDFVWMLNLHGRKINVN